MAHQGRLHSSSPSTVPVVRFSRLLIQVDSRISLISSWYSYRSCWMGAELSAHQQQQQRRRQQQAGGRAAAGASSALSKDVSVDSIASEVDHSYPSSEITKPIGSGQVAKKEQEKKVTADLPKEIVIVSKGETEEETISFTFPPAFKPLIPIGHES